MTGVPYVDPCQPLRTSELNRVLRKRFDLDGGLPPMLLEHLLTPTVVLENDRPEWGALRDERLAWARAVLVPVLGNHAACMIVNPPDSGAIVVVEKLTVATTVSGAPDSAPLFLMRQDALTGALLTGVAVQPRDTRLTQTGLIAQVATASRNVGQMLGDLAAAFARLRVDAVNTIDTPPTLSARWDGAMILGPGTGIQVFSISGTPIDVSWEWRERLATVQELQLGP